MRESIQLNSAQFSDHDRDPVALRCTASRSSYPRRRDRNYSSIVSAFNIPGCRLALPRRGRWVGIVIVVDELALGYRQEMAVMNGRLATVERHGLARSRLSCFRVFMVANPSCQSDRGRRSRLRPSQPHPPDERFLLGCEHPQCVDGRGVVDRGETSDVEPRIFHRWPLQGRSGGPNADSPALPSLHGYRVGHQTGVRPPPCHCPEPTHGDLGRPARVPGADPPSAMRSPDGGAGAARCSRASHRRASAPFAHRYRPPEPQSRRQRQTISSSSPVIANDHRHPKSLQRIGLVTDPQSPRFCRVA